MERMVMMANNYQLKKGSKLACEPNLLCIRREILDAETSDFNYRLNADNDETLVVGVKSHWCVN